MISAQRVLAIGAHTDDIELGCGATLSRLQREGAQIATIAFSRAELSRPEGAPVDILENEYREAMGVLGIPDGNVFSARLPVRTMSDHRQEILDTLIQHRRDFDPDLVLTMGSTDSHQDHEVVYRESVRAFRNRNLLAYHAPWNERLMKSTMFVEVTRQDLERKHEMLQKYRSQRALGRHYVRRENLEATVRFYGQQVGLEFAEAFEAISMTARSVRR